MGLLTLKPDMSLTPRLPLYTPRTMLVISTWYPKPAAVMYCTWRVTPTSERNIEDVDLLPDLLNKIVEVRGCVMQDKNFCGPHFGRPAEGSGQSAPKVHRHQRTIQMASTAPHIGRFTNMTWSGL